MNNRQFTPFNPDLSAGAPMLDWWQKQWLQSVNPMARLQLAWMESLAETMQFEAQFFSAMAESGMKMTNCLHGEEAPKTPEEVHECYQNLVKNVTDAHMERMERVADLSKDFRERIWEEL